MDGTQEQVPPNLPRWVQVLAGLFLLPWAGLSLWGSVTLVTAPPGPNPFFTMTVGAVLLLGSLWVVLTAARLIVGRERRQGGLLTPLALRVTGLVFGAIPIVGLFTGAYWETRWSWLRIVLGIGYFFVMLGLFRLASQRSSVTNRPARDHQGADA